MAELEITGVEPRVDIIDGQVVEIQAVRFRTAKGMKGQVRAALSATTDEVKAMVRAEASRLDDLLGPV